MTRYRAESGFIDLSEYRIAIESIEAVQFTANDEAQVLHFQALLKLGRALQIAIACGCGRNPLTDKQPQNIVPAIEPAIRAVIAVVPMPQARSP